MLLGHSEHRKGNEWSYNTYTPCKWGRGRMVLIFLVVFLLRKPWIGGGERVWEDLAKQTAQVTRMSACLSLGQAEGGCPLLPSLTSVGTEYKQRVAGGLWGVGGRLSWDFPLMPSAWGHFFYSPLTSAILWAANWGPEKWTLKNGALSESLREAAHLWLFRVNPTGLFLFRRGIDAALNRPSTYSLLTSNVPDSSVTSAGFRKGREWIVSWWRRSDVLDDCFMSPDWHPHSARPLHRRRPH